MNRISREALYIQMALLVAQRSTCNRMHVGAVITFNSKVMSTGYNGPSKNEPHCNGFQCDDSRPCQRAIHAEINAWNNQPGFYESDIYDDGELILYCTHQPCLNCSKFILTTTIEKIYYLYPYRDKAGILLLKEKGIKVIQINEAGETIHES